MAKKLKSWLFQAWIKHYLICIILTTVILVNTLFWFNNDDDNLQIWVTYHTADRFSVQSPWITSLKLILWQYYNLGEIQWIWFQQSADRDNVLSIKQSWNSELNRHGCLQSVCVCDMSAILWIRVVCVCSVYAVFEIAVVCVCCVSALFSNAIVCVCDVSALRNYTYVRVCSVSALKKVQLSVYATVTCFVCVCAFKNI